jgi:hypothetical protein
VHLACQSLLSGECDLALAGGATVRVPHRVGYFHEAGSILSPTGHCRSFDAAADGTVFGSGAGVVALRRLEDALRDGDRIHAVLIGSAMNNDGNRKAGYTAPSVDGQAAVVAEALAVAGADPASIGLIEAHGTRHAHRRSHRGEGARGSVPRCRARQRRAGLRQGELRPPRGGGGCHRLDRRGDGAAPRRSCRRSRTTARRIRCCGSIARRSRSAAVRARGSRRSRGAPA